MNLPNIDQLRSFVTVARCGSISAASSQLNRSQSAISVQIGQLEHLLDKRLLNRHARGVTLTHEGEVVIKHAIRVLGVLHEMMAAADQESLSGTVRFGLTEEFSVGRLPQLLREFVEIQRSIEIEVIVEESKVLEEHLREGRIDLALAAPEYMSGEPHVRWVTPLLWVGNRLFEVDTSKPLPLVLIREGGRRWGVRALQLLDDNGIQWRQAYTTTTFASVLTAVEAGLGLTYVIGECLRPTLRVLGENEGLPPLNSIEFGLFSSIPEPPRNVAALLTLLSTVVHNPTISTI